MRIVTKFVYFCVGPNAEKASKLLDEAWEKWTTASGRFKAQIKPGELLRLNPTKLLLK